MSLAFMNWRWLETGEASVPAAAYREALRAGTESTTAESPGGPSPIQPAPTTKTPADLDEHENAQLVHAWTAGLHPEARLEAVLHDPWPYFEGNEDILEHQEGAPIEWWDVVDAESGEPRYVFVAWGNDCGVLYQGTSTQMVAYVAQSALWCSKDWRLWKALCVAHRPVTTHYPESELARMFFAGSFKCAQKGCFGRTTLWSDSDADEAPCRQCGEPVSARNV